MTADELRLPQSQALHTRRGVWRLDAVLLLRSEAAGDTLDSIDDCQINSIVANIGESAELALEPCPKDVRQRQLDAFAHVKVQYISLAAKLVDNEDNIPVVLLAFLPEIPVVTAVM